MNAPRTYQRDVVDRAKARIADRPLVVSGTGSGKSYMGAIAVLELGVETWWVTHRKELVDQAAGELRALGAQPGFIMAGRPHYPSRQVQVASVDTLRRRTTLRPPRLIVIDEAHHAPAGSFRAVVERCPDAWVLGLTATPYRLDGKGLGDTFGCLVEAPREAELVEQGFLVEPKAYSPPPASVSALHRSGGDFNKRELARAVDKPQLHGDVVESWRRHADGYLTIVFAVNVEHSQHLAAAFRAAGVPAAHVDAETPAAERDAILGRFRRRELLVLCNVALFTEGFNVPGVECVSVARPTESLALHRQMIGRATRVLAGKRYPVVLDHAGNMLRHGRITRIIDYTLEGGAPPAASAGTGLRFCPTCYRLNDSGRPRCKGCGYAFGSQPAERELPRTVDGDLLEYDDAARADAPVVPPAERAAAYDALVAEAEGRGLKAGWVSHRFKERFGGWPVTVEVDGRRVLAHEESDDAVKAAAFARWAAEGAAKGFKAGFAGARFKELFGHWPRSQHRPPDPLPAPPDQPTLYAGVA